MKIGELVARGGVTAKTIRFYEQAGVLPEPARTRSGYRDYGPEFLDRLGLIRRAQAAGLSLREIRQILAVHDRGSRRAGMSGTYWARGWTRSEPRSRSWSPWRPIWNRCSSMPATASRPSTTAPRCAGSCNPTPPTVPLET